VNPGPLTVDHFLVVINECVAFPMRRAPQLATGIPRRFEAGKKTIDLRVRIPPDCDELAQLSQNGADGVALGNQRSATAS
jgi:hypothetical protein